MLLLTAASAAALAASAATPRVSTVCCLATSSNVRADDERAWKVRERKLNIKVMWNVFSRHIFKKIGELIIQL